jgi:UDP-N-acetylmuramoylalanine--D-glutamate ligase
MFEILDDILLNKRVLILGFGREGKALYFFLHKRYPQQKFWIADRNPDADVIQLIESEGKTGLIIGENYLDELDSFDLVVKTPGIPLRDLRGRMDLSKLTSQTNLFLQLFSDQIIGITGTKGKSTTSSLIYHIFRQFTNDVVLVGNIGVPPFEIVNEIGPHTRIVFEMSSHQLESVTVSPHIAILLNIYQEHLDHYNSYADYQLAKYKIAEFQHSGDLFIYNAGDERIGSLMTSHPVLHNCYGFGYTPEGNNQAWLTNGQIVIGNRMTGKQFMIDRERGTMLKGEHNLLNVMAAVAAVLETGIPEEVIVAALATFKGLEHRIEYVGCFGGKNYYNDSISTIPEATIQAVKALGKVDTLILGGYDRMIDYAHLAELLAASSISNVLFTGDAGKRMMELYHQHPSDSKAVFIADFDRLVSKAIELTPAGGCCLLSPAAASYGFFKNFEERGRRFKKLVGETV